MKTTPKGSSKSQDWTTLRAMVREVAYDDTTFAEDADAAYRFAIALESARERARAKEGK